ncbi:Hypothetical predicted protein [Paramuricea clavata]|uniref:Uncharacterized protein n=1 Tax=Paramuricea clavata TaxID=317549 RepID=A0A6S7JDW3_PARCT|nr:Hypothetical predicted protein [Paramuricea clavata]
MAILVDPTASIQAVFWEEWVDSIEDGKTYIFTNMRIPGYIVAAIQPFCILPSIDEAVGDPGKIFVANINQRSH